MEEDVSVDDSKYFKILVVGEMGVGKTSIIKKYVADTFTTDNKATIGADFAIKQMDIGDERVTLAFWDISGQDRFVNLTRVYYREAAAALVVFSANSMKTFWQTTAWRKDILEKLGDTIPVILVANKVNFFENSILNVQIDMINLAEFVGSGKWLDQFCKEYKFAGWYCTSAKEGTGVTGAIKSLVTDHLLKLESIPKEENQIPTIKLNEQLKREKKKKDSCRC